MGYRVGDDSIENANILTYNVLTNNGNFNINDKYTLNKIVYFCTDGHHAYDIVANHPMFKDNIQFHIVSKSETCLVESYNSSRRSSLARP